MRDAPTGNKTCHLFHPDGGGVIYRDFNICIIPLADLTLGQDCGSGVVYAGESGGNRLYTTAVDSIPASWNSGAPINHSAVIGAASTTDGMANTNLLLNTTNSDAPYLAAQTCRSLGEEWYLPAQAELSVLYQNRAIIGNFNLTGAWPVGRYWTSTELNGSPLRVRAVRFESGGYTSQSASYALSVRCVRRD